MKPSPLFPLFLALAAATAAAAPAPAASLRPTVVVESDLVQLGDIFEDAGPRAGTPVLHSPAPGRRITLDVNWLAEVARAYRVAWRPLSRFDRVIVERAGKTITTAEIVARLRQELVADGMPETAQVELSSRTLTVTVPLNASAAVDVQNLAYDAGAGRFSALLLAGGDQAAAQRLSVQGRVYPTAALPVPRRAIAAGEVIRKDDIELVRRREDQLPRDIVTDASRLIGTAPRSRLRAGEPVRENETRPPLVITRNSQVIIRLAHGPMTLTAQGRALEDGARGDVIRVTNLQSSKTLEATVAGPDTVVVSLAPPAAVN